MGETCQGRRQISFAVILEGRHKVSQMYVRWRREVSQLNVAVPACVVARAAAARRTSIRPCRMRRSSTEVPVQFSVIALNVLYAVIGVVLMFVSYRMIDRLTPEVDFPAELQKGNVAVAIFIAAIFLSIALIIGKALG